MDVIRFKTNDIHVLSLVKSRTKSDTHNLSGLIRNSYLNFLLRAASDFFLRFTLGFS